MDQKPNPYRAPRAGKQQKAGRGRKMVLWGVLLAPWAVYVLVFVTARVLFEIDRPISDGARELLIRASGGLASGTTRALFMIPSAYLLERLTQRPLLSLEIMVLGLYTLVTCGVLYSVGIVSESHTVVKTIEFIPGVFLLLVVPLFIVWCVRALRRSRRAA